MSKESGLRLHHVGYAAREIGPIAAMYVEQMGYELATDVIHDPAQTALVQFLKLPGDQAYLEFVAPDGPESKLAAAVERGGRLNHLCYTAGPLEDAIARMEARGMRLISAPTAAVAFAGRRICWLIGKDRVPIELVERNEDADGCVPGL
jgi:methylmalonyl-CoA/ethylmalonyl-CoA epimerase